MLSQYIGSGFLLTDFKQVKDLVVILLSLKK